jgi:hypothetical protein
MPNLPTVVRSIAARRSHYADYREELRIDFWFSCAYCSITEIEALGIGFQIDHYEPVDDRPDLENEYTNLMYSCQTCNGHKNARTPSPETRRKGYAFFRADQHHPDDHFILEDVRINHKTLIGEFTKENLYLNRLQLRRLRDIRNRLHNSSAVTLSGIRALIGLSIDQFPRDVRLQILRLKQQLQADGKQCEENLTELLRQIARSPLLDADPEKKQMAKERQKYLKSINAQMPKLD